MGPTWSDRARLSRRGFLQGASALALGAAGLAVPHTL